MREPPPPAILDLEPIPSDNIIKITVAPLSYEIPVPKAEPIPQISLEAFRPDSIDTRHNPDHVYQYQDVDQRPVVTKRVKPTVRYSSYRGKGHPKVVVTMVVTRAGGTRNITLVQSCGNNDIDYKVIDALAQWQFRPALRNGMPVNCLVLQAVSIKPPRNTSRFSLQP
jgi:TonB family protein